MAYDSKRPLLNALLKGLADAVHQDDQLAVERYRERFNLAGEEIDADEAVQDALNKLLSISVLWLEAAEVVSGRNKTANA